MSTPILPFAVWASGTNQNSIPANDNSLRSEVLNGLVISESTDAQPGSPSDGDIYIITGAATGAQWATFDQFDLTIYKSGTWYAYAPVEGILVNVAGTLKRWDGSAYVDAAAGGGGGSAAWGNITGTLSDQTDLQAALDAKLDDAQASAYGLTLLDDPDATTARGTLGLGTAATQAATSFATAAQGALADSATQPGDSVTTLNTATGMLLGRSTAGSGAVEEITLGTNLSFTGTTLNAAGGGGGGSGDVVGPASATADAVALFDGTTGKLLKDGVTIATIRTIPQNSQSANYTLVLADAGWHILHPSADTTARTFTIPANSSVAFPVGTALTFVNQNAAGVVTIAITTDTMRLAGAGTTGSRTLAANGIATAIKITPTEWLINGTGIS